MTCPSSIAANPAFLMRLLAAKAALQKGRSRLELIMEHGTVVIKQAEFELRQERYGK